jgi:dTDP-glucose 4,6-dehydratase
MKRILVTGSAGFVGANFVEYLLEKDPNIKIVGLDSLRHMGDSQRITKSDRFYHFTHDLNTPITEVLSAKIGYIDGIINIASESAIDRSISNPDSVVLNNVNLILNILDFARRKKVDKFIHLSTDEVYGQYYDVPHKEWAKIVPSNPYSASKACQEAIAISYWRTYGTPLAIINCQNMFGKMQNVEKMIPKTIKYIYEGKTIPIYSSNGKSGARKYIHVRNLCSAINFVMQRDITKYTSADFEELPDRYHVGGHDEISNVDLVDKISHIMNMPGNVELVDETSIRPAYDKKYALDDSKLKSLGWRPEMDFDDSLRDVVAWTLKNRAWMQ